MIRNPGKDVRKPGARINIVQFGSDDQRVDICGALGGVAISVEIA
jgi:hypothetical protein